LPAVAPVRRWNFRRREGEAWEFPQIALPRYPLSGANAPPSRIAISLHNRFPAVYRRFRPFIWRGRLQSRRRINHLAVSPFLSPFKNGENGENGAASNQLAHHCRGVVSSDLTGRGLPDVAETLDP